MFFSQSMPLVSIDPILFFTGEFGSTIPEVASVWMVKSRRGLPSFGRDFRVVSSAAFVAVAKDVINKTININFC